MKEWRVEFPRTLTLAGEVCDAIYVTREALGAGPWIGLALADLLFWLKGNTIR